jgi:hypothetical protein
MVICPPKSLTETYFKKDRISQTSAGLFIAKRQNML